MALNNTIWIPQLLILCSSLTWALQSSDFARSTVSSSLLVDTRWKLQLDVGLQPGTWMPKRFPGWAESGARLGLGVEVQFTNNPSTQAEALVGPLTETYQLKVTSPPSTFVSANGEETVEFTSGGWCIQRPTGNIRNAGGSLVRPEGLLRFWLECPTGAKRQDVEIFPKTRIFFTTGAWDDPKAVEQQQEEFDRLVDELDTLKKQTRDNKEKSKEQNALQYLNTFRQMVGDSRQFDTLSAKCEEYGQRLPPIGSPIAPNGVLLAPNGSLVIKGNQTPDWLPGSEYLILGVFTTASSVF